MQIKPNIDPDIEGLEALEAKLIIACLQLENRKKDKALQTLYNARGYLAGLHKYFDLKIKSEYNIDSN